MSTGPTFNPDTPGVTDVYRFLKAHPDETFNASYIAGACDLTGHQTSRALWELKQRGYATNNTPRGRRVWQYCEPVPTTTPAPASVAPSATLDVTPILEALDALLQEQRATNVLLDWIGRGLVPAWDELATDEGEGE